LRRWELDRGSHAFQVARLLVHIESRRPGWVAAPLCTDGGELLFRHADSLWELAPWLAGAADFADRPSLERVSSAAQSLAELHEILAGIGTGGEAPSPVTDRNVQLLEQARELILGGGLSSAGPVMTHWGWPAELLHVERSLRQG